MDTNTRRSFIKTSAISALIGCVPVAFGAGRDIFLKLSGTSDPFFKACAIGDVSQIKLLLARSPELIHSRDSNGLSGYTISLLLGHAEVGVVLRSSGYQPDLHESALGKDWELFEAISGEDSEQSEIEMNKMHPMGGSVMWAAAAGGAGADTWRVYAKCGNPNTNIQNPKGTTILQRALRYPDLAVAEITTASMLSNDLNPNLNLNGDLPGLHIAAERGSYTIVEMLIRLGADVSRKDRHGMIAAHYAEKEGHKEVWQLLENHEQVPRTCSTSRSAYIADGSPYNIPEDLDIPFHLRRRFVGQSHRNLEYVQDKIKEDQRYVHSVATTSERCVEAGAHMGQKELVQLLLQNGAPYSLPTAVLMNDFDTVRRLLDEDPKRINERGAHDFGLLWYPVIGQCDLEMTQLLLDRGATIEDQHYLGTTALHWACQRGQTELVALLIENGANVNRVGRKFRSEGQSPLQITKDEKIAGILKSKGAIY